MFDCFLLFSSFLYADQKMLLLLLGLHSLSLKSSMYDFFAWSMTELVSNWVFSGLPPRLPSIENPVIPINGALDFRSNPRGVFVVNRDNLVRNIVRHDAKKGISEDRDHIINTLSGKKPVPVRGSNTIFDRRNVCFVIFPDLTLVRWRTRDTEVDRAVDDLVLTFRIRGGDDTTVNKGRRLVSENEVNTSLNGISRKMGRLSNNLLKIVKQHKIAKFLTGHVLNTLVAPKKGDLALKSPVKITREGFSLEILSKESLRFEQ